MFALIVELRVKEDDRDRFLQAAKENAIASVRDEPDCLRFDLMEVEGDSSRFYFYEIYRDESGYLAHRETAHYARWRAAAAETLVAGGQIVTRCNVRVIGSEPRRT
jgi:(4S)-4-hydroxy-5-phosphonooxypentane-2,3-dione isomerase